MEKILNFFKRSWNNPWFVTAYAVILIFIVPILINQSYKSNTIYYITMWEAADVLNFYGTLLGAIVSVAILAATILHNRKQIVSERVFQMEQEKWLEIEKLVDQVLEDIHPSKIKKAMAEAAENQREELFYIKLNQYQTTASNSVDRLLLLSTRKEDKSLTELISNIDATMQELNQIVTHYNRIFFDKWQSDLIIKATNEGNTVPDYSWAFAMKVTSDYFKQLNELLTQVDRIYEHSFQPLIRSKREVFDQIKQRFLTSV